MNPFSVALVTFDVYCLTEISLPMFFLAMGLTNLLHGFLAILVGVVLPDRGLITSFFLRIILVFLPFLTGLSAFFPVFAIFK